MLSKTGIPACLKIILRIIYHGLHLHPKLPVSIYPISFDFINVPCHTCLPLDSTQQVLRARVQPNDGRDEWIDLDDHAHLDILELSGDGSRSLSEMIEEVLEEEMSLREKDEYEDRDLGANGNGDWNDDEEEAVASVTDGVLSALRSLYAKGLVGFY